MATDRYSHDEYVGAFEQFMQSGDRDQLASYLEGDRPASFLSVYRNGFIRASASALESNFPTLVKLWGNDYFAQLAGAYVNVAPPISATLIGYGFTDTLDVPSLSFSDFLKQQAKELMGNYPYALDLCRLDQAWMETLNENGDDFLTLEVVQGVISRGEDLSELPMALVDSSQIVDLKFEIFELWGQLRFGEMADDQKIELKAQNNTVIFWQNNLQVQAKPMSAVEAAFMKSLKQTENFDSATTKALSLDGDFDISVLFAELLNAHLLK